MSITQQIKERLKKFKLHCQLRKAGWVKTPLNPSDIDHLRYEYSKRFGCIVHATNRAEEALRLELLSKHDLMMMPKKADMTCTLEKKTNVK